MAKTLIFDINGLSDRGLKREENEDTCLSYVPGDESEMEKYGALFLLADGMGSYGNGRFAARSAVDRIKANYYDASQPIEEAVKLANRSVYHEAQANPQYAGMGTTIVGAVVFSDGRLQLFNVGDSRAYLLRNGSITQLTRDHSVVANRMRDLGISWEESAKQGKANQLTRSVGRKPEVEVELYPEQQLQAGDTLLLCSDGLWRMVRDEELHSITRHAKSAQAATAKLIELANKNGGPDNITALMVRYLKQGAAVPLASTVSATAATSATTPKAATSSSPAKKWLFSAVALAILLLAAVFVLPGLNPILPVATETASGNIQLTVLTLTNPPATSLPTTAAQSGGTSVPYGSLAVLNKNEERKELPELVTLAWEPPMGLATPTTNQTYNIVITYTDQSGQPQRKDIRTQAPNKKLDPADFFAQGKPLGKEGRYIWQVALVEQSPSGQEKQLSPLTPPFVFYWLANSPRLTDTPTPAPPLTVTALAATTSPAPTQFCPKDQFYDPAMGRCKALPPDKPPVSPLATPKPTSTKEQ